MTIVVTMVILVHFVRQRKQGIGQDGVREDARLRCRCGWPGFGRQAASRPGRLATPSWTKV